MKNLKSDMTNLELTNFIAELTADLNEFTFEDNKKSMRLWIAELTEKLENNLVSPVKTWLFQNVNKINEQDAFSIQDLISNKCKLSFKSLGFTKKSAIKYCLDNLQDTIVNESSDASLVKSEILTAISDLFVFELKSLNNEEGLLEFRNELATELGAN
tara:strand:+ start:1292 stop:1765 length:474 start_codon:yes stop_codon:yes gene_type:complete